MAKTEYIDLLPAQSELFYKSLNAQDRFINARVAKKIVFFSRKRKKGLSQKSLLPVIADFWAGLSEVQKSAWSAAGAECGLNGWRLFVQDMCARIYNDIAGVATPSLFHQSWIGNLKVEAPANEIKITQLHPRFYWISQKVTGKKGMYEPVKITEDFSLPLKISLNYSADLVSTGEGSFAKYYASVWRTYQGVDIPQILEIPLDLQTAWKSAENTLSTVVGQIIGYSLFFHLYNVTGNLYIDNVKSEHSAQNWVRDSYCKDILQGFTRAFYQIPMHWAGVIVPAGAQYDSIYKDF